MVKYSGENSVDELPGDNLTRREVIRRALNDHRVGQWIYGTHPTARETRILIAEDQNRRIELTAYLDHVSPGVDATWGALIDSDGKLLEAAYGTKDASTNEWNPGSFVTLVPNSDPDVEKKASSKVNWLLAQVLSGRQKSPGDVNPGRRI